MTLHDSAIASLEPLRGLKQLRDLDISNGVYPYLEPLWGMTITHLDMYSTERSYKGLDYTILSSLASLRALRISGHEEFNTVSCKRVLEECAALRFLDIASTEAAAKPEQIASEKLTVFWYG